MKSQTVNGQDEPDVNRLISITRSAFASARRKRVLTSLVLCLGIILSGFLLIAVVEQYAYLSPPIKLGLWALFLATAFAVAIRRFNSAKQESFERFYIRFSEQASLPALKNALDLALNRRDSQLKLYAPALRQNLQMLDEREVKTRLSHYLKSRNRHKAFLRGMTFLGFALASAFLLFVFLPGAAERTLYAWERYEAPNPYEFTVIPGDVTVEQGSTLMPVVVFKGEQPQELSLAFKTDVESDYRIRPVTESSADTVRFSSITMNSNSSYYIVMDGFHSPLYRAEVQLRPRFETLTATVYPPSYTGLDSAAYTYPFSQIQAYEGSEVVLSAMANKNLAALNLIRKSQGDTLAMDLISGERFVHSLRVEAPDTLAFSMRDSSELTNENPFEIILEPVADEVPFVQIVQPESDLEMKDPADLELRYEATDDFGLTAARLRYEIRRAFSEDPVKGSLQLPVPRPNEEQAYTWKLQTLDPNPRDVITYWVEVTDNNGYRGPQTARSRALTITFPSLTAYLDELENKETDVGETLEEISDSYQNIREEYERFKKGLKENPQGGWEQQQSVEEMKEQQQKLNEQVEELNKKFEEIRQELSNKDVLSDETLKAYDELQDLMKQIDDPELLKALEELQKSLGAMDQQRLREALENYEFNEQQYRERISRTLELFKTLKLNSDLDKAAAALEALAQQEKELSENEEPVEDRIKKQDAIQNDAGKLSEELKILSDNPPSRSEEEVRNLEQESTRQMNEIQKQLEENIRRMQENRSRDPEQSREIREQQKQIQQGFQQMAQQMKNARQQLNQQRKQINVTALQYILYSLINLSQNQEELTLETEELNSRSQAFVEKARIQQTIAEQFSQISDSLYKVSSEVPRFSNSINEKKLVIQRHLASSVEMLAERDKSKSTFAERQSLGGINELATMIASLLDQLQNQQSGGAGGGMSTQQFIEQLQQMSGQQQEMNRRIEELINDIQGDRLSNEQIERLNQLARQQNQIRKQLQQLQQNGGLEPGDKILSELERLTEEMEQTINDLRGGQTDPTLIKRQQNILSRMLSAEEALNERGEDEKREATPAEESPRSTPPDITLEELEKKIRKLLNDPNHTKFTQDYQRLIEQYFELLRKLEEES